MKREELEQNIIFALLKVISIITKKLEAIESVDEESIEKIAGILLKLSNAILKINKIRNEIEFDIETEEKYQFGASEIAIMESYIEKIKKEKKEKGEMVW